MRKLSVFNHVTLDGYFVDMNGDMSWAHDGSADAEFNAFVKDNASAGGVLVFGRITYELMASYWPTPAAMKNDPVVAEEMNNPRETRLLSIARSGGLGKHSTREK
jgi:dihydrofolate reductase